MDKKSFLKAGHTPTLLAAFLYFDLAFMVWVLLGPLAIGIAKDLGLSHAEKGLMVATPVLAGALLRMVMGVLVDRLSPKKAAIIGQVIVIAALAYAWLVVALAGQAQAQKSLIILDASGSMWGQIDGRPKLQIAREALRNVLSGIPAENEIGLMAYGHREKGNCSDIEMVVPPGKAKAGAIADAAGRLRFLGKTPLTDAVKQMTVEDAKGILTGGKNSATKYFRQKTAEPLAQQFQPIVKQAIEKVKLAQTYEKFASKGAQFGLVKEEDAHLEAYVTRKALDGLYLMIAEEEKAIRTNPLGATGSLAQKVFGALK